MIDELITICMLNGHFDQCHECEEFGLVDYSRVIQDEAKEPL